MKTIFLSAGHSNKPGRDRGASSGKYIEGELTVELRKLVYAELVKLGISAVVDVDDSILSQTMAFFKNKTTKDSLLVDIHFNAGPPTAKGVEVLVPAKPSTIELTVANKIAVSIAKHLNTSLRGMTNGFAGVKTELESARKSLGWMRLTGENILIEVCFISNATEMSRYEAAKFVIAKDIARILYDASFVEKTIPQDAPVNSVLKHTVKAGESFWKIASMYRIDMNKLMIDNNKTSSSILKVGDVLVIKK